MIHSSTDAHRNLLQSILTIAAVAGENFRYDLRAAMTVRGTRNPTIARVLNRNLGESRLPDGTCLIRANLPSHHAAWDLGDFVVAPNESLDPTTEYLNGKQLVSADGVITGHAHLHVAKLSEWEQVSNGVMTPSYHFAGGKEWYREIVQPDGRLRLQARQYPTIEPNTLYGERIDLVHVDDLPVVPSLHGQPVGSLFTIFKLVQP
jgi:hypothetical protein